MHEADRVLAGGGDSGTLARSVAWADTAIGPVEGWSQALRSTASLVLHNQSGMLLWWGPEFIQIYNDAYRPVLGDKHPRSMGQPFRECWKEVWDYLRPMVERPFRGGPATVMDDMQLLLDRKVAREEAHFRIAYSPVLDETVRETGIGGVLATVTESTEQAYGERQLRTLRELAARSAAETRTPEAACAAAAATLAENRWDVPFAALYLLDASGRHARLVASAGFDEAPGDGLADVVERVARGRSIETMWCGDGMPRSPWGDAPREAIALPLAAPDQAHAYGVLVCGVSPHRVLDAGYRTFYELAAAQVVTAIRNARALEEERKRAEALAEFDRAKTAFFSNVSHEFRTPLSLILTPLEEAIGAATPALTGADLHGAYRNAKRLRKLVNQLLDFARIEARRARVVHQPTDLAALTSDLASAFRSTIEHAGLYLRVDCPPLARTVLVDPDMWEKIVLNLISNAFKFTFEGGIDVELRDEGEQVVLRVRDTGVGIAEHELPRLFERFHRIEGARSRSHEGSGIGLALVADLVRLHDGTVSVKSAPGCGTELAVALPHTIADTTTAAAVTTAGATKQAFVDEAMQWLPPRDEPAPERALLGGTILLADDNADMRAYIARLLGRHWTVIQVADGAEALARARAAPPDLVLADVMMPNLDGFGLVRELRADPQLATTPIILVSARAGEESIADGLRSGADDYIVKPFTAAQLLVRVEAQLATSRAKAATFDERRRIYTALMDAPNPVAILSGPHHTVELANRAWLASVGDDPAPLLGAALDEVHRTGEACRRTCELGDVILDAVCEPVHDASGAVASILVLAVDVTQQVRAQRTAELALAEARRANQIKDEFLALLGHELRNPMAPIMTALDLMKARGDQSVTREREVIERQSKHLVRLVDDLLDVARISRGAVDLSRERVPIADVVAKGVEISAPLYAQRKHQLGVEVAPDLLVDVDPGRMTQVISNLLTNAAKYTAPGGVITLRAWRDGDEAVIAVRDNGIGIAADVLPRVFEMFVQEGQGVDRARGGLGLGLAIVRALVRRHGGEVVARSAGRGAGSEFEVRLPIAQEVPVTDERTPIARIPHAHSTGRVLIVDDNADAATLLADAVSAMGHEARIAHDGASALEVARSFHPDVALLDIGLPVMNGYEVALHLRSRGMPVRLVAVSGYGQPGDQEQSQRAGFEAHMVKPVDIARLADTIEHLIASR